MTPDSTRPCLRCGTAITELAAGTRGPGRPRKWCSPECRKLASEERRAAARGAIGIEIRQLPPIENVRVVTEQLSPKQVEKRVLGSTEATRALLHTLAREIRAGTFVTGQFTTFELRKVVAELIAVLEAINVVTGLEFTSPAAASPTPNLTPQHVVEQVLSSPRSIREVLHGVAEMARAGQLNSGAHEATVNAAMRMVNDMVAAGLIRLR